MAEVELHFPRLRVGKEPWVTIYAGPHEHTHYIDFAGRWTEIERVEMGGRSLWEHRET